jgi:glycerophosphoryl diester phosphodiesterase
VSFDLQGHRGARGLAPENTLRAFSVALATGVSTLELDTAVTRDGVVVVAHDRRLNPDITRGADGRWLVPPTNSVYELGFEELQRYDVGRIDPGSAYARRFPVQSGEDGLRMPALSSVFELARASAVRFNIETKISPLAPEDTPSPRAFCEALLADVRRAGLESRVTLQSFDWRTLGIMQALEPRIDLSYLTAADCLDPPGVWTAGLKLAEHGSLPRMVSAAAGGRARVTWSPDHEMLTPAAVREALALGLGVLPWTVNHAPDMGRLIDWGITGLITDFPDRARAVLRARGMALPRPWLARPGLLPAGGCT